MASMHSKCDIPLGLGPTMLCKCSNYCTTHHLHTVYEVQRYCVSHAVTQLKYRIAAYSAKFSRCTIFAVFVDWTQTAKIKLGPQNLFLQNVQYDQTAKIVCLKNLALYSTCKRENINVHAH